MESFILTNINFVVLVILYRLILSRNGIPYWNRWVLISLPLLSFIITYIQLIPEANHHLYQIELPTLILSQNTETSTTFYPFYQWIFFSGIMFFSIIHITGFLRIFSLHKKSKKIKQLGKISVYNAPINASFNKSIFIKEGLSKSDQSMVIEHELAHVKQFHTLDKLFSIVVQTLIWYNPMVYLWQLLIEKNHEYLADEAVLRQETPQAYSLFLLQQKMNTRSVLSLSPESNMSHLKSRIIKIKHITKNPSKMKKSKIMYLFVPFCLVVLSVGTISAKQLLNNNTADTEPTSTKVEEPDVMPEFQGGQEALYKFLSENIKYPSSAKDAAIEGTVYVAFTIDKKGNVTKAHVKQGVDESLDNEALRVINTMPKWIPGEKDGKKVSVEFTLPIKFLLPSESK